MLALVRIVAERLRIEGCRLDELLEKGLLSRLGKELGDAKPVLLIVSTSYGPIVLSHDSRRDYDLGILRITLPPTPRAQELLALLEKALREVLEGSRSSTNS